ncbi:SET domain-containing protein 5 [Leucoagaricus sp. SymC.cos]|nr:SET domain-containing protein 5 [Leucoagaricus sp. SymC.cos]
MTATTKTTLTKQTNNTLIPLSPLKRNKAFKAAEYSTSPPSPLCAAVNKQIRLNPSLAYPDFDFVSYVQHRSYTISTIDFGRSMAASFLDNGVHDILADLISHLPPPITISPSFEVCDAREKGLGMFSTSFIAPGNLIFEEHPVIISPYLLGVSIPLAEMYTELFESLPKTAFALATSLATSHQDDVTPKSTSSPQSLPPPSFYEDLMQTNSVAVDLLVPTDTPHHEVPLHRALFLQLSRCNHSCNPNAVWSWSASTLTLTLTALRPIPPGEEITISYISLSGNHAAQHQALKDLCGFDCTCEECTLPSYVAANSGVIADKHANLGSVVTRAHTSESDENTVICDLPTFEEWFQDFTLPDTALINAHKAALQHIGRERIASSCLDASNIPLKPTSPSATAQRMDHHVEVIAMCYGALGDVTNFRRWIAISKEARSQPQQKIVFNRWLSNPLSFPLWARRKQKV